MWCSRVPPGERRRLRKVDFEPEAVLPGEPADEDEYEVLRDPEPLVVA